MALTFFQKLQVAFRVWSRRRDDDARKRDEEFLKRNVSWGSAPAPPSGSLDHVRDDMAIDLEGLQVAYLDDSGRIAYYLDIQTGDVVEIRGQERADVVGNPARYKRVPQRAAEAEDRIAFVDTLEDSRIREFLRANVNTSDFRKVLATDRNVERAWYNFRNQRATNAVASWLRGLGLR